MATYPQSLRHGSGTTLTLEPELAVVSLRPGAAVTTGHSTTSSTRPA